MRFALFTLIFALGSVRAADPLTPPSEALKTIADAAEPSVLALVISHNPLHGSVKDDRPWELGDYVPAVRFDRGFRRQQQNREANPLDLSDIRNAANYTVASSIVVDAERGLLLTTAHLLDGARKVYVRFPGGGGSYANIHAADFRSDLAVLKLQNRSPKLRTIPIANVRTHSDAVGKPATVARGNSVISLAHLFGVGLTDGQPSVSWGILSNVGRKGTLAPGTEDMHPGYLTQYSSLLQTDARLNLGSSGGALLNMQGELIGMTSAAAGLSGSEAAGGYAIPMDEIYRGILNVLKQGREVEYGFLGVMPGRMNNEPWGLNVDGVTANSGAALAGMVAGDIITSVNGRPLRDESDLYLLVGGSLAGNTVTLGVRRGGGMIVAKPRLGKFQHPYPVIASEKPEAIYGLRVDYATVLAQQQLLGPGARFGVNLNGVVIRELEKDSPAERALQNLQPQFGRWLITRVDGIAVTTPPEFYAAVGKKQRITLTIVGSMEANQQPRTVTLP